MPGEPCVGLRFGDGSLRNAHRNAGDPRMGKTSTTIRLTRMPYNSDSATAFGLGWKLGYAFDNPVRPRLEVFVDNDVARDGDWSTYGIPPEAPAHLATTIAF